jgi:hypothetical protein
VLNRNTCQVDFFEAANINGGDPISFWIDAFSVRVNAARPAKAVLDDVLVERVGADVLIRCKQPQLFPGDKPQKRSFARTHRAIACHRPIEIAFDLKRSLPAVTATFVLLLALCYPPARRRYIAFL